jgi:hypothetical protein
MVQRGRIFFDYVPCCSYKKGTRNITYRFYNMKTKKPKDDFIKVRISSEEKKLLEFHATKLNTTISELVRKFIIIKN